MENNTPSRIIHQSIILDSSHAGKRIDIVIKEFFEDFSRSQIQKWIDEGLVLVNGNTIKRKYIAQGFESIKVDAVVNDVIDWIAEDGIDLNIVYEDNDIYVINKQANMVVHPGAGNTSGTVSNAILSMNKDATSIPRAGIVHRLDKDTTGLMVIAKNIKSYNSLTSQLSDRTVSRRYYAIVEGIIMDNGIINRPIGRCTSNRTKMAIVDNAKEAITEFTPIEIFDYHTLIECKLQTGRTHQIRVHMKSINHPIIGDQTYNKSFYKKKQNKVLADFKRQALHAFRLSFIHPSSNKEVVFEANMPNDMINAIEKLE